MKKTFRITFNAVFNGSADEFDNAKLYDTDTEDNHQIGFVETNEEGDCEDDEDGGFVDFRSEVFVEAEDEESAETIFEGLPLFDESVCDRMDFIDIVDIEEYN